MKNYKSIGKILIILSSLTITLQSISFGSLAVAGIRGLCSNGEFIGFPNNGYWVVGQSLNVYGESLSNNSASNNSENNQNISENYASKLIILDKPGDYRLIGSGVGVSNPQNPNEIIVGTQDVIRIKGPGEYNVILDNVNIDIDINKSIKGRTRIFSIINADVRLIFEGENNLKNNFIHSSGLYISKSNVTIEAANAESTLNVNNITCTNGNMEVASGIVKVFGKLNIDSPNLDSAGNHTLSYKSLLKVNGGKILSLPFDGKATGNDYMEKITYVDSHIEGEIFTDNLILNSGEVNASKIVVYSKLIVNDGKISGGEIYNAIGGRLLVNGGVIEVDDVTMNVIVVSKGDLLLKHIYGEPFNGKTIKNFNKIFGLSNDEGDITACSKNRISEEYKTGYIWYSDPNYCRYFYITGGTINGIGFSPDESENHKLKDNGKTFLGGNLANNFCDIKIDFEN